MPLTNAQILIAQQAATALLAAGLPAAFLPLALAQLAHETGGFKSRVMSADNNLSGIKYAPAVQKNVTQGRLSPEGNNYAHFKTVKDWAVDYIRLVNKGTKPPIQAKDTADLAQRLRAIGYYTDTVANYSAALASWLPSVKSIAATAQKKSLIVKSVTIACLVLLLIAGIYYYKFTRK